MLCSPQYESVKPKTPSQQDDFGCEIDFMDMLAHMCLCVCGWEKIHKCTKFKCCYHSTSYKGRFLEEKKEDGEKVKYFPLRLTFDYI